MLENEVGNYFQVEIVHQHLANRLDHLKISGILPEHCLSLIPFHQFSNKSGKVSKASKVSKHNAIHTLTYSLILPTVLCRTPVFRSAGARASQSHQQTIFDTRHK